MKNSKKVIKWALIIIIILGGGIFAWQYYRTKRSGVEYTTHIAKRGTITQTVSITGSVKPASEIDLNFKIPGRLEDIKVKAGDEVKEGEELAQLEKTDLSIEVRQAEAALRLAQANLNLKITGASPETIKVSETARNSAKVAIEKAESDLENLKISTEENIKKATIGRDKTKTALEDLKKTSEEKIKSSELAVSSARTALLNAEKNLTNTKTTYRQQTEDAYEAMRLGLKGYIVTIFSSINHIDNILGIDNKGANDSFEANLGVLNPQSKIDADGRYKEVKAKHGEIENLVNGLTKSSQVSQIDSCILLVQDLFELTKEALDNTRILLDNSVTGPYFPLDSATGYSLNGFKTTINTDRISINTGLSSLETQKQAIVTAQLTETSQVDLAESSYDTAKSAQDKDVQALAEVKATIQAQINAAEDALKQDEQFLEQTKIEAENQIEAAQKLVDIRKSALQEAEASLGLTKSSPREVDIASLRAQVAQAKAQLDLVREKEASATLKAPLDGLITKVHFSKGEQVSLAAPVISMLGKDSLEIEVDIPEADITKVEMGDKADITLDAFGDDVIFGGKVVSIEPAETLIQGVIYYKVKVAFEKKTGGIKSGMTANVDIKTDEKENVLFIPQKAIQEKNGEKLVKILKGEESEERKVVLGLRGDEGMIEVISGLKEGDRVITFVKIR